jgi:hypothetical protein
MFVCYAKANQPNLTARARRVKIAQDLPITFAGTPNVPKNRGQNMSINKNLLALAFALALLGCNKEDTTQLAADGKATGAACRHAGRAIEDCFSLNPEALRSAMFDGWKEMNDYMRENNIAAVTPQHKPEAEGEAPDAHAEAGDAGAAEATKVAAADHEGGAPAEKHAEKASAEEHAAAADTADKPAAEKNEH